MQRRKRGFFQLSRIGRGGESSEGTTQLPANGAPSHQHVDREKKVRSGGVIESLLARAAAKRVKSGGGGGSKPRRMGREADLSKTSC